MKEIKGMEGLAFKSLLRLPIFIYGFIVTYFSYFLVTIGVLDLSRPGVGVGIEHHGYPFTYYTSNCWGGAYFLPGLLGNILFAALVGTIVGLVCAYIWQTVAREDFRKRWHL